MGELPSVKLLSLLKLSEDSVLCLYNNKSLEDQTGEAQQNQSWNWIWHPTLTQTRVTEPQCRDGRLHPCPFWEFNFNEFNFFFSENNSPHLSRRVHRMQENASFNLPVNNNVSEKSIISLYSLLRFFCKTYNEINPGSSQLLWGFRTLKAPKENSWTSEPAETQARCKGPSFTAVCAHV